MKFFLSLLILPLALLSGVEIDTQPAVENFPSEISFEAEGKKYDLQLTGTSLRKKFGFKVYRVAHYREKGTPQTDGDKFQHVLNDDKAKELYIKWIHAASSKQMHDGYIDSFKNTLSPADYEQLNPKIQQYLSFFNEPIQKGDIMVIRWIPGGKIQLLLNDKEKGNLTDPTFAKALWNLWFGEKSVVNREELLNLEK